MICWQLTEPRPHCAFAPRARAAHVVSLYSALLMSLSSRTSASSLSSQQRYHGTVRW